MTTRCPLLHELQMHDVAFPHYLRGAGITRPWQLQCYQMHEHHVWPGQRVNVPSNLLSISSYVHDYLHGKPIHLRVAGIWARSKQPLFNWQELNTAAGLNVLGWLEFDKCDGLPAPYCWWREELLEGSES